MILLDKVIVQISESVVAKDTESFGVLEGAVEFYKERRSRLNAAA